MTEDRHKNVGLLGTSEMVYLYNRRNLVTWLQPHSKKDLSSCMCYDQIS